MAKIEVTRMELVWPGKYDEDGRIRAVERARLPFQVIERINESRATREANKFPKQASLFDIYDAKEGDTYEDGWRNKLIWGDNLLVMGSLWEKFAGKLDLIYIDPPFATGADFSFTTQIGDDALAVSKEQSILEEKAYRDTWGRGIESYLTMIASRIDLMRDLLSDRGSLLVHVDYRVVSYMRLLLDEFFGPKAFRNEIIWHYYSGGIPQDFYPRKHDTILWYAKGDDPYFLTQGCSEPRNICLECGQVQEKWNNLKKNIDENGRIFRTINSGGKTYKYYDDEPALVPDVWLGINHLQQKDPERTGYVTQKPERLLHRIIATHAPEGGLIADFFCGSGTSLVTAEKLGRRWIGCDLGRFAIHTTRKRLLGIENCRSFEILNLGKYERQYWQGVTFGNGKYITEQSLYEYLAFILKLYEAQPISGMIHLHGKKGKAMVHIGTVDSPVTIDEINLALDECAVLKQTDLHVLGWEWEMGLAGPSDDYHTGGLMHEVAKQKDIKLHLLQIPREVMEQQAVDKGDVQFFELAYLEVEIQGGSNKLQLSGKYVSTNPIGQPLSVSNPVIVHLKDFVIANTELIPPEVREKVRKWSDYIDYWAVDWDFQNDTFMNGWVTYRTHKERSLSLHSDPHAYAAPGRYTIVVKVVDIFGNDTTQAYDVEVH